MRRLARSAAWRRAGRRAMLAARMDDRMQHYARGRFIAGAAAAGRRWSVHSERREGAGTSGIRRPGWR